ncbi:MAG: tetratricopeptide repeat protein [Verrucomicrobiales bacterium]|nr:tetratricopeptide repeat protein [Verrucomicrobiales bacterium]
MSSLEMPEPPSPSAPASRRRRASWGARILALVLAPLLVLGVAEALLRLAGFGYATSYFVPSKELEGRWVENPNFGRLHFPAGLLRVPPPTVVRREKPAGTYRVLIFGESAAMGDPKPAFGVARYLEVLLKERYPGAAFEVVPVAMTAINSHALVSMARAATPLNADCWVVYAGNNELLGPFGAGATLGRSTPSWRWVRLVLAARATRLGQAIEALAARWREPVSGVNGWVGVRVLAGDRLGATSPERERVYASFARNLTDIAESGRSAGAAVVFSTVAVNLRDCAPFGSEEPAGPEPAVSAVRSAVAAGLKASDDSVRRALEAAPGHAGVQYLAGRGAWARQEAEGARDAFRRARDLDTLPLRAESRLNGIVAEVAKQQGLVLVDAEAALARGAAAGVPGGEMFYEHVHLTPEGNHALAVAFAEAIAPQLPESLRARAVGEWAAPETCATRLGLTAWARAAAGEMMMRRCVDAPFTNRLNHVEHLEALAADVSKQRRAQTPETASLVRGVLEQAVAASPEDAYLARVLAEFLEATGDPTKAIAEWERVTRLLPHHPYAWLQAGGLLRRQGKTDEARPFIERAVALLPDWVEAHLEVADLALSRGRPVEAIASCRTALRLQPDHARAHYRLADALAADRQREAAVRSLEEAVRLDSRLWEARYLLGVEYALVDRLAEAQLQFEEVVRLRPDHARGHFNLGIAYARQRQWERAGRHLSEVLRLDPKHDEARKALAQVVMEYRKEQGAQTPAVVPGPTPVP